MDPSPPEITLRDIAHRLGISHTTVSRALHDDPRISQARRAQVKDIAQALGYRANPMATALGQQRRITTQPEIHAALAWLNFWSHPGQLRGFREFDLYWSGASRAAERAGYRLEEFAGFGLSLARLVQILEARGIHGLLMPPHRELPPHWEAFPFEQFSIIRFGYSARTPPVHLVTSDHLSNGILAFERAYALGYRRLGLVTSQRLKSRFKAGFLMKQLDVPKKERVPLLILPGREDHSTDFSSLRPWLEKHRPDGIVTDLADLRDTLASIGRRVPEDIGLAALSVLDGNADAGIYQNSEEIGQMATELLLSQLREHRRGLPEVCQEILIRGRWVDGLTMPPRG